MHKAKSYRDLAERLRMKIRSKAWLPGQMLPGRRALAAEYGVASATVERAISVLVAEETLISENRRGTFVSNSLDSSMQQNPSLSFRDDNPLQTTVGIISSINTHQELSFRKQLWPAQILSALENRLSMDHGITQSFFNLFRGLGKDDIDVMVAAEKLVKDGADAIVLIQASRGTVGALLESLNIPLIYVDIDPVDCPVTQIHMDACSGGYQAYMHLRKRGYTSISYLRPFTCNWVESRLRGVHLACSGEVNIIPAQTDRQLPLDGDEQKACGYEIGAHVLGQAPERGTGFIAPNDAIAEGFIDAVSEYGLRPGSDYGIIGFDDYNHGYNLTSIRPPLEQLGQEAAMTARRILKGEPGPSRIALKPPLIPRCSTNNMGTE